MKGEEEKKVHARESGSCPRGGTCPAEFIGNNRNTISFIIQDTSELR